MSQQVGGNPTPFPLGYFSSPGQACDLYQKQILYNECGHPMEQANVELDQSGGGPTPYPLPYFNPKYEAHSSVGAESKIGGIRPLPNKFLDLNRHLNTLGNNAEVIGRDNLRRLYNTYREVYGLSGLNKKKVKALFKDPALWGEFRNSDYTVKQLLDIVHQRFTGKDQSGGNAVGAPFFIPNYGVNPNLTSGQLDEACQVTTGHSYRFKPSTAFSSMWGSNQPSFYPVNNM